MIQGLVPANLKCVLLCMAGESGVDQLVEIIKVLGTPTREEIYSMNPNYTEFKFPKITAHPWSKVFSKRMPPDAVDLVLTLFSLNGNHTCLGCPELVGGRRGEVGGARLCELFGRRN